MSSGKIYVSFKREDKFYCGSLSPVSGAGSSNQDSYHLMIHNRYYGCLHKTDRGWVFNNQWDWNDLAQVLGKQVEDCEANLPN